MSETSDPSNLEMLERLTAELRCLRPDVREPEFKNWRADMAAFMAELFGPGHRMTVALRDVNFSPRFEQGRTRAMALLRAANSLVAEALPQAAAAAAAAPPPDLATQPTVAADDEPTPAIVPDETAEAVSEPLLAAEPIVAPTPPVELAAADPVAAEPVAAEPIGEEPVDEEPAAPLPWPDLTDWPTPVADAAEPPEAVPGADASQPESIAAATELPDDDAGRPLSATEEDAFTLLMLAAEARPKRVATPEADAAVEPALAATAPECAAGGPKRAPFLRKVARKRGRSCELPSVPHALDSPEVAAELATDQEPAVDHEVGPVIEAALAAEPQPAPEPDPIEEPDPIRGCRPDGGIRGARRNTRTNSTRLHTSFPWLRAPRRLPATALRAGRNTGSRDCACLWPFCLSGWALACGCGCSVAGRPCTRWGRASALRRPCRFRPLPYPIRASTHEWSTLPMIRAATPSSRWCGRASSN